MRITGTFLDEISHDIPHQNWGPAEWDRDFATMKSIGIDTVILIRCGYGRWLTYPSDVLMESEGARRPPIDLVDLFLSLSDSYGMAFYFGTYDSARYWHQDESQREVDLNRRVIDEVWSRYGHREAFSGWYLSQECSRRTLEIIQLYAQLGQHCKEVSDGLPMLISPWVDGVKPASSSTADIRAGQTVSVAEHEREWMEIMDGISESVDVVAFQDGHVHYHELPDFLRANKTLADRHGFEAWTNCESFDRDMPIKFLPIKFEKMLFKLEAAREAGYERAITFEFSHFMSPNSSYLQAHHLFNRYCEHHGINPSPA